MKYGKYKFLPDALDCPYCKYPYGEEEMEAKIWGLFRCDSCNKKIRVALLKGRIVLQKRLERMVYFDKLLREQEDHKYMRDFVLKKSIFSATKDYNSQLKELFFTSGKTLWVREAREIFYTMCATIDIPNKHIVSFFEKNGGKTDYRTINSYLNGQTNKTNER